MKLDLSKFLNGNELVKNTPDGEVIGHNEIKKYTSLDELFDNNKLCKYILYEWGENNGSYIGHWVCFIKLSESDYLLFDSYGEHPLEQFQEYTRGRFNTNSYLMDLIMAQGNDTLSYNTYDYQKESPKINTCGYHCFMRQKYRDMEPKEYKKMVLDNCKKYNVSPDELAVIFCKEQGLN